jgi:predicted nucleic acid-binding Zn ribbon protein
MTDSPLTRCPKPRCRGAVKRKIGGGAGLLFKGSGFYITDYRSAGYQSKAKADSAPATAATPATPAKPAAKAEAKKPAAAKS